MEGLIPKGASGQAISRENLKQCTGAMEAGPSRPREFVSIEEQLNTLCEAAYNNCITLSDLVVSTAAGIGAEAIAERVINRIMTREKEIAEETEGFRGLQILTYKLNFYMRLHQWLNEQYLELVVRITSTRISVLEAVRDSKPKMEKG